jgi:hypothetical protein
LSETAEAVRPGGAFGSGGFPDEARRMSDAINLARLAGDTGRWLAIRMHDGGSDGIAYDFRADAIRHQIHPEFCTYIRVTPGSATPAECWPVLRFTRWAYDQGFRITSPEDPDPIMPGKAEDLAAILRQNMRL